MPTTARRLPYLTHLRVFEPVSHLPAEQRERWTSYARHAPERAALEGAEFDDAVRRLAATPPHPVPLTESDEALLLEVRGELFVCPEQPLLRAWHGLGVARDPEPLGVTVPDDDLRARAAAALAARAGEGGEVRLFTRTAAWQVPLAWFVPFEAGERQARPGRTARPALPDGDGPSPPPAGPRAACRPRAPRRPRGGRGPRAGGPLAGGVRPAQRRRGSTTAAWSTC
nr:hypothetical protein [Angustibacter aerolatus]